MDAGSAIEVFSPAKINLMLAVTGLRSDGYHDLISLVSPVTFGDSMRIVWHASTGDDQVVANSPQVPLNADNLAVKAARLFKARTGVTGRFTLHIDKRIPIGAGLGGGSSNAAATLKGINQLCGDRLAPSDLSQIAAEIGADCPLFLENKSVIMRGRGERIEHLPDSAQSCLSGQSVLLFKPDFSISTAWAYGEMRRDPDRCYVKSAEIEKKLSSWLQNVSIGTLPFSNNMQDVSFRKYIALPVMLEKLLSNHGLPAMMSGSGSACFAILNNDTPVDSIRRTILDGWGKNAFVERAEII